MLFRSTDSTHGKARIIDVAPGRIREAIDGGHIAIVAGFQGVSQDTNDVTTLGRGGSDTTAVALAVARGAAARYARSPPVAVAPESPRPDTSKPRRIVLSLKNSVLTCQRLSLLPQRAPFSVARRRRNVASTLSSPNHIPEGMQARASNAMTSIRFLFTMKLCSGPGASGTPGSGGIAR